MILLDFLSLKKRKGRALEKSAFFTIYIKIDEEDRIKKVTFTYEQKKMKVALV
ncbi:hypothetical protein [Bacillus mycoides]|uniref:hypothetical protein n=1 Tax=Bacillus mycoides TaxID=1405 RepID=UPI001C02C043|nr:hypothetical protein [Bacillus mycoides]